MQYQKILDTVHAKVSPLIGCGRVADYIPGLAAVDPRRFGLALATTDGAVYGAGDWQTAFSIQSVSKVFSLALVLRRDSDAIWRQVYARPDTAIRRDVIDHVLRRILWIDDSRVHVHVDAGVVTLTGAVGRRTTAGIAARLTAQVPGVVAVVDEIRYDFDDVALARSRIHRTHPFSAEPFKP